jgi:oxygen-independent coproporphyrinogen III oxidase
MAAVAELAGAAGREAVQVHWGGGTPTFLPPEEITALMAAIRGSFRLAPGCEIGVEVDPRRLTESHTRRPGGGRGQPAVDGGPGLGPVVQRAVNRVQPAEETWWVLEGRPRAGMTSVNIDLIYGLPHQTPETFAETVDEVVRMSPDRIAVFNFAYLPECSPTSG